MRDLPPAAARGCRRRHLRRRGQTLRGHRLLGRGLHRRPPPAGAVPWRSASADSPYLAFVDIGGVGNTGGEWLSGPAGARSPGQGWTTSAYYSLVKTFVEMYRQAFPDTRLYISYECIVRAGARRQDVERPAAEERRGRARRRPGRLALPAHRRAAGRLADAHALAEAARLLRGGRRGHLQRQPARPRAGPDPGLALQAVPAHLRQPGRRRRRTSQRACKDMPAMLERYGRRLGYRLALLSASVPAQAEARRCRRGHGCSGPTAAWRRATRRTGSRSPSSTGAGRFVLAVAVAPAAGGARSGCPASRYWSVRAPFECPANVPAGDYSLKLRLLFGRRGGPTRPVKVATKGADADGRYTVGTVHVRTEAAEAGLDGGPAPGREWARRRHDAVVSSPGGTCFAEPGRTASCPARGRG